MKGIESDIHHRESLKKTLEQVEQSHTERINQPDRLGVASFDDDVNLQLMQNRTAVTERQVEQHTIGQIPRRETPRMILKELSKLKHLTPDERERLRVFLLEQEGHDLQRGRQREFGVAEGVESIGINIFTLEYLVNAERGRHESVIGRLAQMSIDRTPGIYPKDIPSPSDGAESDIMHGLIHRNVPGWKVPLVRLQADASGGSFTNQYMSDPRKILPNQLKRIHEQLISRLGLLPLDKFCMPLK